MSEATIEQDAPETAAARTSKYREFKVDLWATSLNDVEIGLYQTSRHRAKSEQFTKDMDVIGQVTEDGARAGLLAYRMDPWKSAEGMKRRLILKLFSPTMNWRATLDLMIGRSLQLTHGAGGVPTPAYSLNIGRHDQIIQLERSADKWAFFPEKFSFFLLTENGPKFYKLRQRLLSIGRDYALYDQTDRRIGYLDGKLMNVGGLWKVRLKREHDDPQLAATLQLFCGMLRFNKAARAHIDRLSEDVRAGRVESDLDRYEKDLYSNPRWSR